MEIALQSCPQGKVFSSCCRAMEAAVKWMYSVDGSLTLPFDDRLAPLMDSGE